MKCSYDNYAELRQKLTPVTDFIWPCVPPETKEQREEQKSKDRERKNADINPVKNLADQDISVVKNAYQDVIDILYKEQERVQTSDNKLATLFALTAISVSIVLSVNGLARMEAHWSIILATGYSLVQLIRILTATINGLARRKYTSIAISDIAPSWTDSQVNSLIEIINKNVQSIHDHQDAGNAKITALAIAHTAFRNFLLGLILLFTTSIAFS